MVDPYKIGMSDWEDIIALANQIKDLKLRKLVLDYLKDPRPTHRGFKQLIDIKKAPAADQWHHTYPGGLLKHTLAVARFCLAMAEPMEKTYGTKVDRDVLLASALCHDLMKVCEYELVGKDFHIVLPLPLDHLTLGVAELYTRGFPENVVHCVAAHHGEAGPILPSDIESIILHFADITDAYANTETK